MDMQVKPNWFVFTGKQWLNSLKVFFPPEIKLFSLLTVNSFIRIWKNILHYFWWLLLAIPAIIFIQSFGPKEYSFYTNSALALIQTLLIFILYVAIRPSLKPKDYPYFLGYWKHCFYFGIYFLVLMFIGATIFSLGIFIAYSWKYGDLLLYINNILTKFIFGIFIFSFFFFLDTKLSFNNLGFSFIRGIKMAWYGLPFTLICLWLFNLTEKTLKHLIYGIFYLKAPLFSITLVYAVYFILFSLLLCMFNIFYNKRVAEG